MKDSLILYTAYGEKFKKLTDEQFGKLTRFMIHYQMSGEIPEITDPLIELSFDAVKYDIDANNEKYEKVVQRNKQNGAKGGRPRNPEEPKKPSGFLKNPKNPDEPKKADDNDNDNENVNDNDIKNVKKKKAPRFLPPTVEEVKAYCDSRNNGRGNNVDPVRFVDFYESKGWMVGSNKMKDWKACVRTWEQRDKKASVQHQTEPETNEAAKKRHDKYDELTRYWLGEE